MGFCTACGAQRTSNADRFCPSCGKPYDPPAPVDWTLPAAGQGPVGSIPTSPMPASPPFAYPPGPPVGPPGAPPTSGSSGRSGGMLLLVSGLVLALLAGAFVAWQFLWPRGGAGSPEAAAEQVMLAATEQDPVAMLDLVNPAEVEGLDDVYAAARDRAEDEEVIEDEGITDALTIELTDLEFDVEQLGDDYARVTLVDGANDVSWDPEKLPERLADIVGDAEAESESGDFSEVFDDELGSPPSVTTVRIDGRWYVTLLGTSADYGYRAVEGDVPAPDYDAVGEDVEPIVGENPEDVVANLVDAINSGDVDQILANFPEDLARPLRPYAPIIQDALDGGQGESLDLEVSAEDLELETEELEDGRIKVVVEHGLFSATATEGDGDGGFATAELSGDCAELADEFSSTTGCLSQEPVLEDLGITEFYVVMREVDGGYQLDPTGTYAAYATAAIDGLNEDLLDQLIDGFEQEAYEMEAVPVP